MGTQDYAYQRATALHRRIGTSELAIIEGAGHACNIEQPARWNELALDFLRRRTDVLRTGSGVGSGEIVMTSGAAAAMPVRLTHRRY